MKNLKNVIIVDVDASVFDINEAIATVSSRTREYYVLWIKDLYDEENRSYVEELLFDGDVYFVVNKQRENASGGELSSEAAFIIEALQRHTEKILYYRYSLDGARSNNGWSIPVKGRDFSRYYAEFLSEYSLKRKR